MYTRGGIGSSVWARFFNDDPVTRASLQGSRLRRSGRLYSFVHKSIPEYFVATAMWADVMAVVMAIKAVHVHIPGETVPEAVNEAGVSTVFGKPPIGGASRGKSDDALDAHALSRISLSTQPAVLSFVIDMLVGLPIDMRVSSYVTTGSGVGTSAVSDDKDAVVTYHDAVAALHAIVRLSASRQDIGTASSNCGSVLAQAGVSLHGAQWNGVRLKDAVLSDSVLNSASLRGADLSGVHLERVTADFADFSGVNFTGASLGQYPMLLGHTKAVTGLVLSPDGKMLASCSDDKTVRLWDAATSRPGAALKHDAGVLAVAFFPDCSTLVSTCDDHTLRIWKPASGIYTTILLGDDECDVARSIAVSPDGRHIAAGFVSGDLRVYDSVTRELVDEKPGR